MRTESDASVVARPTETIAAATGTADYADERRSIRVCLVSFSGYPDQGATYFFEMARSLARLGHDVTAVAVRRADEPEDSVEDGVRVIRMALPLTVNWASPRRWAGKFLFLGRAAAIARRGRFDIVHVYCTMGSALMPLLGGRQSRWVHEYQTGAVSARARAGRWLEDRVRGFQGRFFDANFVVTAVLGRKLFGSNRGFEVVPAGVNPRVFHRRADRGIRSELGIPDEAIVFVHAGVVETTRGTDVPVRAFAHALGRDPRLWLLMPGKGSQLAELRRLAGELGIQSRVWLPGYIPYREMPRVFAAADAGLSYLPAVDYYDGQPPMKVMEYLAAGLPVIASDVSSHRLLVREGANGLLPAPDVESFAAALVRFAADAAARARLAQNAPLSVAELTYDGVARERVVPAYRRLLEAR